MYKVDLSTCISHIF